MACADPKCPACDFESQYMKSAVQPETDKLMRQVLPLFAAFNNGQGLVVIMNVLAQQMQSLEPEKRKEMLGLTLGLTLRLSDALEQNAQGHA